MRIQGHLEEDDRSGHLRLSYPSPKGLADIWVTEIKNEEMNELLFVQGPLHGTIKYLLKYLGPFISFFLDITLSTFNFMHITRASKHFLHLERQFFLSRVILFISVGFLQQHLLQNLL